MADSQPAVQSFESARVVVPALAISGAILAGMGATSAPLTAMAAVSAFGAAIVSPAIGLALIALMGPLQPPLVIPAPGFNVALVVSALLGCVYRLPIERPQIRFGLPVMALAAFVVYVAVQQAPEMLNGYATSLGYLAYSTFRELLTGFGTVIVAVFVLSRRSPYPFVGLVLCSATVAAALAIITVNNPGVGAPFAGLMTHTSNADRGIGPFGNPNYFGVFEATAVVAAVGLMLGPRPLWLRLLLAAVCLVCGAGLALSLSRGAIIAFAAGLACLAFSWFRPRVAIVIAGALLAGGLVLFPLFIQWRLGITNGSASANSYLLLAQSDEGRLRALLAGPQMFLTAPIFGIGWGHYSFTSAQFAGPGLSLVAHNWYVSVLAETGLVGVVLTALFFASLARGLLGRPPLARSIGLGVLAAYAVGCLYLEAPTSFETSVLAIVVVVAALASDWQDDQSTSRHDERTPRAVVGLPTGAG